MRMRSDQAGFTLIETLVVVMIIGILAAIAFGIFSGQRTKAQDAEAKTAATVVTSALIIYHQDHDTFATADLDALRRIESAIANLPPFELDTEAESFEIVMTSRSGEGGGGPFTVEYRNGVAERTCDAPGEGGCPEAGVW
jgi:prepilin-type N-terminal cleavage/methylation domain-containing protein